MANAPAGKQSRPFRILGGILVAGGGLVLLLLFVLYTQQARIHELVRDRTEKMLQTHFASKIEFSDFDVVLFPRVHVTITDLVMRHNGRTDIAPLVQIRKASMEGNLLNLLRPKPHIAFVRLEGLQIHIPPKQPGGPPLIQKTDQDLAKKYPAVIEEMVADDATIVILRAQPDKPAREMPIHHLDLHDLSFDRPAKFRAALTNFLPKGEIEAEGEFGPWLAEVPRETVANGKYIFRNADLGTIKGLRGILSSQGTFSGPLDYLKVDGIADVPDFTLRTADRPTALHTEFSAFVDGGNGDTYLTKVTANFRHSTLLASGKIVDEDPQTKGRTVILDATSQNARVEDLIRLAVKTDEPIMTGLCALDAKISIPEGDSDLISRLKLQGQFHVAEGEFSAAQIQDKIDELSRKAQGKPKETDIRKVSSQMAGNFTVNDGVASFSDLKFSVTGAVVHLKGNYTLDGEALDFHGSLVMQAKISQTTTGAKSFFLKAVDPFFEGKNAGTVLPIKISGTKDKPEFGLDRGAPANKNAPAPRKPAK